MPYYLYEAIDPASNKLFDGRVEAENLRVAKEMIRTLGHIPTRVEEDIQSVSVENVLQSVPILGDMLSPQATLKDVTVMTQQLQVLLSAGIPLIESLFLLEQQSESDGMKTVLRQVRTDVIAGESFSGALMKFPKLFPRLYVNIIRAGEVSGEMDTICKRLAALLEKLMQLQGKITGATIYPAFTIGVVVFVVAIIMVFVIPMFQSFFAGFGAELPLPTRVVIAMSDFTVKFWWAMLIAIATFTFWFNSFRLGQGKALVDQWILTIPILGLTIKKLYVSRFVRTLATVIGAGVSLTEGLATAAGTVDNYVLRVAFEKARESLLQGGTLSKPLEQTGIFPVMVVKMIAIAEETGQMEEMLNKSADFLDQEVDRAVDAMTSLLEPIMIVVVGAIVAGIAIAIYLPIFEMGSTITSNV
ncbi:MAG: type II secretion system F family protein [Candidatus Melainabacteria bacterium]